MEHRAYKFRMYPNDEQKVLIGKTFGCVRFVWNKMLNDAKEAYKNEKKLHISTPARYKTEYEWLKEVDSLALCNAQLNLKQAYSQFFASITKKRKKPVAEPKFRSKKNSKRSYTTNNNNNNIRIEDGSLVLPKLGKVECVFHRFVVGTIKSATISQDSKGNHYVSILCEVKYNKKQNSNNGKVLGLDYSSHDLFVDSEGNKADYPRFYRQTEDKIARLQFWQSKKVIGSRHWRDNQKRIGALQTKIRNQRKNFLETLSTEIARKHSVVVVEDINMRGMAGSLKLGKSTNDNGFGMFREMIARKTTLVKSDKFFPSSQMCSCCGMINSITKDLSVREWDCECGVHHDRDVNAAENLVKWYESNIKPSAMDGLQKPSTPDTGSVATSKIEDNARAKKLAA